MSRRRVISSFMIGVPSVFISSLLLLSSLSQTSPRPVARVLSAATDSGAYSLPPSQISMSVSTADARPLIIRNYLRRYRSLLEPYSRLLVETADKYSLDYRLLVAIAHQESSLCHKIPPGSHNCWGFGIYADKVVRFDSYPEAIDTVARTLKKEYIDKGLDTPEKIMAKYTPPSVEIGGPWAKGVSSFLVNLQ